MQVINEDENEESAEARRKKKAASAGDGAVDEKAEEERKKKLTEGWSDRDKGLLDIAKQAAKEKLDAMRKELNKGLQSD